MALAILSFSAESQTQLVERFFNDLVKTRGFAAGLSVRPTFGFGYEYEIYFACMTCDKRWSEKFIGGVANEVIDDIHTHLDTHKCNLELGPAGAR
jgi:hypothetical protein